MNRTFGSLLRLQIRLQLASFLQGAGGGRKRSVGRTIGFAVLILVAFAQVALMYGLLSNILLDAGLMIGAPELVLALVFLAAQLMLLFLGLLHMVGALYGARDITFLASLPVPAWQVYFAKFAGVYLFELFYQMILILPTFVLYGVKLGMGALFYVKTGLLVLIAPFLPLTLAALLAMLLMRVSVSSRFKNVITTVGSFVLIIALAGGMSVISSRAVTADAAQLAALLEGGLIQTLTAAYPPASWATSFAAKSGVEALLPFVTLLLASALGLYLLRLLSFSYYRIALAHTEASARSAAHTKGQGVRASSSITKAVFRKEWRMLTREPIYAINSFVGIIMPPLLLLPLLLGGGDEGGISALLSQLGGATDGATVFYILAGVMGFIAMINPAASTCVSREGRSLWLNKVMPISGSDVLLGKFYCGYLTVAPGIVLTAIIGIVLLPQVWVYIVFAALWTLIAAVGVTAMSVQLDCARPKLNWDNAQEAIKQNMNSMLAMLLALPFFGLQALAAYGLSFTGIDFLLQCFVLVVFAVLCSLFALRAMLGSGKTFEALG